MLRIAAVAFLAALLSGCYASKEPKFAANSAVHAIEAGRYATFERVDGQDVPGDPIDVRTRSDGAYDFVNDKGVTMPVTFHAIAGGLHVAQVKLQSDQGYGYVVARVAGTIVHIVPADCDTQDKAALTARGVEIRGRFECWIDGVKDAGAFFASLKKGESTSRMAKE